MDKQKIDHVALLHAALPMFPKAIVELLALFDFRILGNLLRTTSWSTPYYELGISTDGVACVWCLQTNSFWSWRNVILDEPQLEEPLIQVSSSLYADYCFHDNFAKTWFKTANFDNHKQFREMKTGSCTIAVERSSAVIMLVENGSKRLGLNTFRHGVQGCGLSDGQFLLWDECWLCLYKFNFETLRFEEMCEFALKTIGTCFFVAPCTIVVVLKSGDLVLYTLTDGCLKYSKRTRVFPETKNVYVASACHLFPTDHIAVGCLGEIHIWNIADCAIVKTLKNTNSLSEALFWVDNKYLVINDGIYITVWN